MVLNKRIAIFLLLLVLLWLVFTAYNLQAQIDYGIPVDFSSLNSAISKWGADPLTKHHKDSVIHIAAYGMGLAHYVYYRRVINNNI